jgi:hypothetical protein
MSNNNLTKSYTAEAAIGPFLIVKPGAADYGVVVGAAVSDKLFGVSTEVSAVSGERVDIVHEGIADVKLGGTVVRGDFITSDATGQGLTAAPAAGTNNRVIGIAIISGVSGDIIPVLLDPSMLQG